MNHIELNFLNEENNYCCICLNTNDYKYITLECCGKTIHLDCIIDWLITETNIDYKCPRCRKSIKISKNISIGNIIDYIITKKNKISRNKYDSLLQNLYDVTIFQNDSENQSDSSRYDSIIQIYNNKLKMVCLCVVLIGVIFILFVYYSMLN